MRVRSDFSIRDFIFMTTLDLHNVNKHSNHNFYTAGIPEPKQKCKFANMKFRLQHFRAQRGMTQQQVAEAIGISTGLYNQLESGKRRMNQTYIETLAHLYGVAPIEMIVDDVRSDPLFAQLDEAYRQLTLSERKILVSSAKGIASAREES